MNTYKGEEDEDTNVTGLKEFVVYVTIPGRDHHKHKEQINPYKANYIEHTIH